MDPIKEFSKTVLSLENCVVPKERLLNTPSRQDGVDRELEVNLRLAGCECIQTAGLLLKLPQVSKRDGRERAKERERERELSH